MLSIIKSTLSIFLITTFLLQANAQSTITLDSTVLELDTVFTGLDVPWEIRYNETDGMIWVTERYGMLSRLDLELGVKEELLDLSSQVYQSQESGLLGFIFHPDFANTPQVFLVYLRRWFNKGATRPL